MSELSASWTFKPLDISALGGPLTAPEPTPDASEVEPRLQPAELEDVPMSAPDDNTAPADTPIISETPVVASVETRAISEEPPVVPAPAPEPEPVVAPLEEETTLKEPTPAPVTAEASEETAPILSSPKPEEVSQVETPANPVEEGASAEASASSLPPVQTPTAEAAPADPQPPAASPPPSALDKGKGRASPELELPVEDALSPLSEAPPDDEQDQIEDDEDDDEDDRLLSHSFPAHARTSASDLASHSTPVKTKKRPRASNADAAEAIAGNKVSHLPLPHYTIKRSYPNSKANPHVLSINPGVTDASSSRWPKGNDLIVGNVVQGAKCWYDPQPIEEGRNLGWRIKIAEQLAEMLGETNTLAGGKKEEWILEGWPAGYKFFIHHSGKTGDKDRLDPYLFGPFVTSKFRTVNEFLPHLQWLLLNAPGQRLSCKCKYCTHSTQGDVNRIVGLDSTRLPHSAPPAAKRARISSDSPAPKQRDHEAKKFHRHSMGAPSTKPPAPKPKPAPAPKAKKAPHPTYDGAFVDPTRDQELGEGAVFRRGEMVWAELPRALTSGASFSITHWPAVVGERKPVNDATLLDPGKSGTAPSFKNNQRWKYRVQLIALEDKIWREETELKAWLAYESSMPTDIETIIAPASVELVYDGPRAKVLRPKLSLLKSPAIAATPYALSMQIAAHIVASFSLTDRYMLEKTHIVSPNDLEPQQKAERGKHLTRWHYNSIWWGAEHIWAGELVRFLTDAGVVEPHEQSPGADQRGCFLKIAAIYKNTEAQTGKVVGVVYELAEVSVSEGHVNVASGGSAMSAFEKKAPCGSGKGEEMFMPVPPPGYVFRRLTPPGGAVHLDIEYIAGRYYPLPEALQTPEKLEEIGEKLKAGLAETPEGEEQKEDEAYLGEEERAFVLAGLAPAYRAYMKCHRWVADRKTAMITAENTSRNEMGDFITAARSA